MLVKRVGTESDTLRDPVSPIWQRIPAEVISLMPTPVLMQPSEYVQAKWKDGQYGHTKLVSCQAVHNGTDIAFRLVWLNPDPKIQFEDNDDFTDAAAISFPLKEGAPITMGDVGAPVNIWYWRADWPGFARINIAKGVGTSQVVGEGAVTAVAVHQGKQWQLVFCRAMAGEEGLVTFSAGRKMDAAFAVWQGSNKERAGLKAFSPEWHTLTLEA